jgi:uncharacterized membrane protein YuzA (DUF378 family)
MKLHPQPLTKRLALAVIGYLFIIFTEIFVRRPKGSIDWILVGLCTVTVLLIFFEPRPQNKK